MECLVAMGDHFKAFEIGFCDHEYFLQDDTTADHLLTTIDCLVNIRHPLALEIFPIIEQTMDDYYLAKMNSMYFIFQFVKFEIPVEEIFWVIFIPLPLFHQLN